MKSYGSYLFKRNTSSNVFYEVIFSTVPFHLIPKTITVAIVCMGVKTQFSGGLCHGHGDTTQQLSSKSTYQSLYRVTNSFVSPLDQGNVSLQREFSVETTERMNKVSAKSCREYFK